MSISIKETGAALGAEIAGVDLRLPLADAEFEKIREAFYRYEVIYFRGHDLSDADHIRFSARFGSLRKLKRQVDSALPPEINVVSNILEDGKHIGSYDAGRYWHTDGAYYPYPHAASLLRALEVPERDGRTLGDTYFTSVSAAYDALPAAMKRRLEGLEAVHSYTHRYEKTLHSGLDHKKLHELRAAPKSETEAVHPVVRVHPVNGRKCLYLTEGYTTRILGLPEDESRDLLAELTAHCVKPEFQYCHNWRLYDLVMWDDCSTQHKATFDYALPLRRCMHRTTVIHGSD